MHRRLVVSFYFVLISNTQETLVVNDGFAFIYCLRRRKHKKKLFLVVQTGVRAICVLCASLRYQREAVAHLGR